jgi:hypothetical protein
VRAAVEGGPPAGRAARLEPRQGYEGTLLIVKDCEEISRNIEKCHLYPDSGFRNEKTSVSGVALAIRAIDRCCLGAPIAQLDIPKYLCMHHDFPAASQSSQYFLMFLDIPHHSFAFPISL